MNSAISIVAFNDMAMRLEERHGVRHSIRGSTEQMPTLTGLSDETGAMGRTAELGHEPSDDESDSPDTNEKKVARFPGSKK